MDDKPVNAATMRKLRHDVNNQLSNIHMALEAIRHETPAATDEFNMCADVIYTSALKINELLKEIG
jgi:hypothetical protein